MPTGYQPIDIEPTTVVVMFKDMDWEMLREQKAALLAATFTEFPKPLYGIIHLIDVIQGEAALTLGDKVVFGITEPDEEEDEDQSEFEGDLTRERMIDILYEFWDNSTNDAIIISDAIDKILTVGTKEKWIMPWQEKLPGLAKPLLLQIKDDS